MNKKNVLRLAEHLEKIAQQTNPFVGFTMYDYATCEHECGTAGCVAGHAYFLFEGELAFRNLVEAMYTGRPFDDIHITAENWLGVNPSQAHELFLLACQTSTEIGFDTITPEWAASTLRHLAATGRVEWNHYLQTEKRSK